MNDETAGVILTLKDTVDPALFVGILARYVTRLVRIKAEDLSWLPDWMEPKGWRVYVWTTAITALLLVALSYVGPTFGITVPLDLKSGAGWIAGVKAVSTAILYNEFMKQVNDPKKKDPGT